MKYAIISDIHANPTALERVLADSARYGVEKVVCAGDVVGYGYDPIQTIRILRDRNILTVMGNHDAAVAGWRDTSDMIGHARDTDMIHHAELGANDLAWLRALPYVYADENLAVAHANFVTPQMMAYVHDQIDARHSLVFRDERMLFVGHTHLEALFAFNFVPCNSNPVLHHIDCRQVEPRDFRTMGEWRYLINVGSVGYPRVKPYSSYVLYDSATGDTLFRRVTFDFAGYVTALRVKSIPVPEWLSGQEHDVQIH